MKFSLKAIFALLTLTSLLALVYQEKLKLSDLNSEIVNVQSKIASYDLRLEKDLPLLRRAVEPDKKTDELLARVEANIEEVVRKNQPDLLDLRTVSIFYQPSLGDLDPVTFQVFVPENLTATFDAQLEDANRQPVDRQATDLPFQPSAPFKFQLPAGLSTIEIGSSQKTALLSTPTNFSNSGAAAPPALLSVQLNGRRILETTFVGANDFRLSAPRWANRAHRLELSEEKQAAQVVAASLFRQFDQPIAVTSYPEYYLKYRIKLGRPLDSDDRLLRTENGVEE